MWLFSDKVLVRESGLLDGFCDCHCHLLPGVDDGVQERDETMQILEVWASLGVKEVWLTPHIMEDIPNEPVALRKRFETLTGTITGTIELHLAAEHMMDGLFLKRIGKNEVMPFNVNVNVNDNQNQNENKKLLVETSYYTPPMNMGAIIERIKEKGYEPLLAHPERYQYMDDSDYKMWKQRGVLLQLNLPSLVGAYGPMVQRKAEWLLKEGMYDYSGTDTHSAVQMEMFLNSMISKKTVKKAKAISNYNS
jgi:tyrosine-protein phosphatase YwqE